MSAFGTKKPGGDFALQLTFPSVYSSVYGSSGAKEMYYPATSIAPPEEVPVGHDLQSLYHEQKRLDANRMAMAGVRSQRNSDVYAREGNAGYGVMPAPVLSQRRYANPSNGNQADVYAARYDQLRGSGEMTGGVLRTRTGQQWGKQKLLDRVNQLNAISEAKAGFLMGQSVDESITPTLVEQGDESVSSRMMLDLIGALNQFQDQFRLGKTPSAIGIAEYYKALRLLFRVVPMADREMLDDLIVFFEDLYSTYIALRGSEEINEGVPPKGTTYPGRWADSIPAVLKYLKVMSKNTDKPVKERRKVSAAQIKTLGITSLLNTGSAEQRALDKKTMIDREKSLEDYYYPGGGDYGGDDDDDDGGDGSTSSGYFPPGTRGIRAPRFDPSPRANWASRSGAYFGEQYDEEALPTSSAANPMRRMASAEMPVAEGRAGVPVFNDFSESAAANAEEEAEGREDFTSVAESREDSEHRSSASSRATVSTAGVPKISRKAAIAARAAPATLSVPTRTDQLTDQRERRVEQAYQRFGSPNAAQKAAIRLAVMRPGMSQVAIAADESVRVSQPTVSNWLKKAGV